MLRVAAVIFCNRVLMQLYNFHPLSISTLRHIKGCQHEIRWALKQRFCAQNGCNNGLNIISMNLDIGEYILQWRWHGTICADLTRAKKTSFFWIYSQFNGLCFTFRTGLCKIYSFIIYFLSVESTIYDKMVCIKHDDDGVHIKDVMYNSVPWFMSCFIHSKTWLSCI